MGVATEPLPLRIHKFKEELMIESNCKHCGSPIRRYGKKPGVFCSKFCKGEFESADWSLKDAAAMYESGKSLDFVANHFGVSKETIRKGLSACGQEIRNKTDWLLTDRNPTKGKPRSKFTKQKLRRAAKRQFSDPKQRENLSRLMTEKILSGKMKRSSQLEELVADTLDDMGVVYERQKAFRDSGGRFLAVVDFCIDGLLVEVNGTFWHSDPRKYPNGPVYECQKRADAKHSSKLDFLKSQGHNVCEIWEIDINNDVRKVLTNLLKGDKNET